MGLFYGRTSETGAPALPTTLRGLLWYMLFGGIVLFLPHSRASWQDFHPEALFLVYLPLALWGVAWAYVTAVRDGFRLVDRRLPALCLEGERLEVELDLEYHGLLPFTRVLARDGFDASDILQGPEILVYPSMADRAGRLHLRYVVEASRGFGDFSIGPLRLVVSDPLDLFTREIDLPLRTPLKVLLHSPPPAGVDLEKDNALTPLGDSRSTRTGSSLEFYGIKEYAYGDDIRALCWAKTAQIGRPVLKTFELDARPDVVMVVNTSLAQVKGFGFGNTLKRILRLASGFLHVFQARGLAVRLLLPVDDEPREILVPPAAGHHTFVREFFAGLEGSRRVDLAGLLEVATARVGPSTVFLVLSHTLDIPLEPVIEWLFVARSRNAKVAVWVLDDADMVRFNEQQQSERLDKQVFVTRMGELGVPIRLVPIRASAIREAARREGSA